jgi:hypothetical protein
MGGRGTQRPVRRGNAPKKTGARSARARTRGQNPLVSRYWPATGDLAPVPLAETGVGGQEGDGHHQQAHHHPRGHLVAFHAKGRHSRAMLRIRDVYPVSRIRVFSIPDPNFFHSGSRICIKEFKYFNQCCGSMTFWGGSGSADPCL